MRKSHFTDSLLTFGVPALACCGVLVSALGLRHTSPLQASADSLVLLIFSGICALILVWWLTALTVTGWLAYRVRRSATGIARAPALPWVPHFIRNTVFALVGLGALAAPACATGTEISQVELLHAQEPKQETANQPKGSHQVLPFFHTGYAPESLGSPEQDQETERIWLTAQKKKTGRYTPLSPFFQLSAQEGDQHLENPGAMLTFQVQPGDTLWDIASRIYQTNDPVEISDRVAQIVQLNREQLESADIIYAGQVLQLPEHSL